jgi:hypothetical protein
MDGLGIRKPPHRTLQMAAWCAGRDSRIDLSESFQHGAGNVTNERSLTVELKGAVSEVRESCDILKCLELIKNYGTEERPLASHEIAAALGVKDSGQGVAASLTKIIRSEKHIHRRKIKVEGHDACYGYWVNTHLKNPEYGAKPTRGRGKTSINRHGSLPVVSARIANGEAPDLSPIPIQVPVADSATVVQSLAGVDNEIITTNQIKAALAVLNEYHRQLKGLLSFWIRPDGTIEARLMAKL